ncbi:hypothetical protein MASR1M32_12600 [Rhodobacter sp.]
MGFDEELAMNVLLEKWDTPFGLPPFASIRDEDFAPAFDEALARARAAIAAIADGPATDFAGVIEALELAEGDLDRVSGLFYNLAGADSNDAREALMRDLAPKMSAIFLGDHQQQGTFRQDRGAVAGPRCPGTDRRAAAGAGAVSPDVRPFGGCAGGGAGGSADGCEGAAGGPGHAVQPEPAGG